MKADRNIHKGEQIFNTYGELSNAQLLHSYGFVEAENNYDNVLLPVELVVKKCGECCEEVGSLEEKKEILLSVGILPSESFLITKEDMLPDNLLTCV